MVKIKLQNRSPPVEISLGHTDDPLGVCLVEPHIGETSYAWDMHKQLMLLLDRGFACIFAGDLINADDLRGSGIISEENVMDQMDTFLRFFGPYAKQIPVILQSNHDGSRIYSKKLSRQYGNTLTNKWGKVLSYFKEKGTIIYEANRPACEIQTLTPRQTYQILLSHPSGLSSPTAYANRLKKNYELGTYDIMFSAHFHSRSSQEAVKRAFGGYLDTTEIIFIPAMIEDPDYGVSKGYAPSHAGFTVLYWDRDPVDESLGRLGGLKIKHVQR